MCVAVCCLEEICSIYCFLIYDLMGLLLFRSFFLPISLSVKKINVSAILTAINCFVSLFDTSICFYGNLSFYCVTHVLNRNRQFRKAKNI